MSHVLRPLVLLALATMSCTACSITPETKSAQLERVAKDWSLVIRASQVLPTYPLTEDLRPGDVYLTATPIGSEVALYESRGFLPFDHHVSRLDIDGMDDLYRTWPSPDAEAEWRPFSGVWPAMPIAGFPTYTFSIARGGGVNLALPVQGVPIGFNMLGSDEASGTITLKDARTYGTDIAHIDAALRTWIESDAAAAQRLREWGRRAALEDGEVFLRVVSRVFLVRTVNIQLVDGSASGLDISAGASRPVNLLDLNVQTGGEAVENYKSAFELLDSAIGAASASPMMPGGSLKLVSASARSVSLDETFDRPLVIGYHAFDYAIGPGGDLGTAVSTLSRVDPDVGGDGALGAGTDWTEFLRTALRDPSSGAARRDQLRAFLDDNGLEDLTIAEFVRDTEHVELQSEFSKRLLLDE